MCVSVCVDLLCVQCVCGANNVCAGVKWKEKKEQETHTHWNTLKRNERFEQRAVKMYVHLVWMFEWRRMRNSRTDKIKEKRENRRKRTRYIECIHTHARAQFNRILEASKRRGLGVNFINNAKSITFLLFSLEYSAYFSLDFPFSSWAALVLQIYRLCTQSNPSHAHNHHHHRCIHVVNIVHFYILCLVIFRSFTILFAVHSLKRRSIEFWNVFGMDTNAHTRTYAHIHISSK